MQGVLARARWASLAILLLTACGQEVVNSAAAECEDRGGVFHPERQECFGEDQSPGESASLGQSATSDDSTAQTAFQEFLGHTGSQLAELATAITLITSYGDDWEGVSVASDALGRLVDAEQLWLASHPPHQCYAGAYEGYLAWMDDLKRRNADVEAALRGQSGFQLNFSQQLAILEAMEGAGEGISSFADVSCQCPLLAGCGGMGAAPADVAAALRAAGASLSERELNDGRTSWGYNSDDEDVLVNLVESGDGGSIDSALVIGPPIGNDPENYPGSRYVAVLDEALAPGLAEWITEEATGRGSDNWSSTREFGGWTVEIGNYTNAFGMFSVSVKRGD